MKRNFLFLIALLLFGIGSASSSFAQRKNGGYFSIGPSLGFSTYQGDLDDNGLDFWNAFSPKDNENVGNPFKLFRPGLGFSVNYHFHPHMFVRLQFNQGWINGDDKKNTVIGRQNRNLNFRSPVTEVSAQLVYEFFGTDRSYRFRPSWTPYIFAGVGVFAFNPQSRPDPSWTLYNDPANPFYGTNPNTWYSLQPLGTEGQRLAGNDKKPYALTQVCIPLGIGVRKKLNDRIDVRFDIGLRKTFTDYMDDVSGPRYANPQDFINAGQITALFFSNRSNNVNFGDPARILNVNSYRAALFSEIRGNNVEQDWYAFTSFSMTYILGKADRCPRFKFK